MPHTAGRRMGLLGLFAAAVAAMARRIDAGEGEAGQESSRAFTLSAIEAERARSGQPWREFLRVPSLSMGVYSLAKGAKDGQSPHKQDEVYYVTKGRAVLKVDGRSHPVGPGSVLFVAAHAQHRFEDITEDLSTLVFFAPAETE